MEKSSYELQLIDRQMKAREMFLVRSYPLVKQKEYIISHDSKQGILTRSGKYIPMMSKHAKIACKLIDDQILLIRDEVVRHFALEKYPF